MFSRNSYNFTGRKEGSKTPLDGVFNHDGLKRSSGVRPIRDRYKEASPLVPEISNYGLNGGPDNSPDNMSGVPINDPVPGDDPELIPDEVSDGIGDDLVVEPTGFDTGSEGKGKGLQIGTGAEPDCALKLEVTDKVASRQTVAVKGEGTWEDVDAIEYWSHGDKKITARPVGWRDSLGDILLFKGKYIQATYLDDNEYDDVESAIKAMWSNFLVESAKQYESFKKNFPFNLAQKKDKQGKDGKVAEPGDSKKK